MGGGAGQRFITPLRGTASWLGAVRWVKPQGDPKKQQWAVERRGGEGLHHTGDGTLEHDTEAKH